MTDHDLATLLQDHVRDTEPPFALAADTSITRGRRTLLRRRARRGFAGVLVAAAAIAAVPLLPWGGAGGSGDRTGIDPLTAAALESYDAAAMPKLIEDHVGEVLARSGTDLGPATFTAGDSQGESLPASLYDKASSMEVEYGAKTDHRFRVSLMHSAGEAEGDARENCANDLAEGYDFSCTVTTSPDGDPVTTRVMAVRPLEGFPRAGWGALTREELRTGVPAKGDPVQGPIDPDDVYFQRMVEVVHSTTFLTTAIETVRARDLATANGLWQVPVADLESIVTDPELVIPKPPLGKGGCAWTWHADVACE